MATPPPAAVGRSASRSTDRTPAGRPAVSAARPRPPAGQSEPASLTDGPAAHSPGAHAGAEVGWAARGGPAAAAAASGRPRAPGRLLTGLRRAPRGPRRRRDGSSAFSGSNTLQLGLPARGKWLPRPRPNLRGGRVPHEGAAAALAVLPAPQICGPRLRGPGRDPRRGTRATGRRRVEGRRPEEPPSPGQTRNPASSPGAAGHTGRCRGRERTGSLVSKFPKAPGLPAKTTQAPRSRHRK